MLVDHVKFYVADIEAETSWLVDGYGFAVQAKGSPDGGSVRSVELGANEVRLILVEPPPREIPATGPDHARTRIS